MRRSFDLGRDGGRGSRVSTQIDRLIAFGDCEGDEPDELDGEHEYDGGSDDDYEDQLEDALSNCGAMPSGDCLRAGEERRGRSADAATRGDAMKDIATMLYLWLMKPTREGLDAITAEMEKWLADHNGR